MRRTLLSLVAFAGLLGGAATQSFAAQLPAAPAASLPAAPAAALPAAPAAGLMQTVQYYYGGYDPHQAEWREREWRHREWVHHHRWEEHRWHEEHHGW